MTNGVQGCKMSGVLQQPFPISASVEWVQAMDYSEDLCDGRRLGSVPVEIAWQLALGTHPPTYLPTKSLSSGLTQLAGTLIVLGTGNLQEKRKELAVVSPEESGFRP